MHRFSTDGTSRRQVYVGLGAVALGIVYAAKNLYSNNALVGFVTFGVISSVLILCLTRLAWRRGPLPWLGLVDVPDLRGSWSGFLYTSTDPDLIDDELIVEEGEQKPGMTKMEATLHLDQTWDKISVTLVGPESTSYSHAATILVEEGAWPTLTYNYLNQGSNVKEELDPHYGTATLEYQSENGKLEGRYYTSPTERGSHGCLEFERD